MMDDTYGGGVLIAAGSFFGFFKSKEEVNDDSQKSTDTSPEAHVKSRIREALEAIRVEKYEEAEQIFHDLLKQLQKYQNEDTWTSEAVLRATIYVFSLMGNLAIKRGQLERAEALFVEVMRGLVQDGKPMSDDAIVVLSLKIASMRAHAGKPEDAEIGYQFCVNTQKEKVEALITAKEGPDEELLTEQRGLLARSLHAYSQFLAGVHRLKEAEAQMRETLAVADSCLPDGHYMRGILSGDLGNILSAQGNHKDSIAYFEKALKVETDPDVHVYFLCSLATAHAHLKDFKQAEKCCVKAAKEAEKSTKKDEEVQKVIEECVELVKALKNK